MKSKEELLQLVGRHARPFGAAPAHGGRLPRLALLRSDEPTVPLQVLYEPMLCIVVQGRKRTLLGDAVFEYGADTCITVSLDVPVTGEVIEATPEHPYLAMALALDRTLVADLLLQLPPSVPSPPAGVAIAVHPVDDDLRDAAIRLLRLIDRPDDVAVLAPLLEREIVYRLLTGGHADMLRQIVRSDGHCSRIGRAVAWLREHHAEPLRIDELAQRVSMTPSSLHRHFKAVTALSPLQYQKQIRLQEARRLLLGDVDAAASIAFRVGYESPSQFSREYRRQFGAPPQRDAARLRGSVYIDETGRLANRTLG